MKKTIITPSGSLFSNNLKEVYSYRGLLRSLAWKDLRVKYAQTFIGLLWALINPLFTLLILTFVFGIVVNVNTGDIPHILYTIAGLCGWTYFSELLTEAGNSIISNQNMVQKIYFPRLILPLSKALTGLVDLGITLILVLLIMVMYGYMPSSNIIYLPFFIILAIISGLAGGIWVSALTVRYRDFRFVTQFIVRLGLYATPVAYASTSVPESYRFLFNLNPLVGIVEGFRWSILGTPFYGGGLMISIVSVAILLVSGLLYFNKVEKVIADII